MVPGSITCQQCGWQNETTARMCGGCGTLLLTSESALYGSGHSNGANSPTQVDVPYAESRGPVPNYLAPRGWNTVTNPAQAAVAPRHRHPFIRALIVFAVVLAVLIAGSLTAWAMVIRPAVHATVNSALSSTLDGATESIAANIPVIPSGEYSVSASALNNEIIQLLPTNLPIHRVHLSFANNGMVVTYGLFGTTGEVTTQLYVQNGRVHARNTQVTGMLALAENNTEMQALLNEALGKLPARYHVRSVRTAGDTLYVGIGS